MCEALRDRNRLDVPVPVATIAGHSIAPATVGHRELAGVSKRFNARGETFQQVSPFRFLGLLRI
jgi:hypothetical protein